MAVTDERKGDKAGRWIEALTKRNEPLLLVLLMLAVAAFGTADPRFLSLGNLLGIAQQTAVIAITAFAMTAVIVARGIDISVGSTLALSGVAAGLALQATGSGLVAIAAALLAGTAVGLFNGLLIGFAGISPFVATLAVMAFARGAALSLSGSSSLPVADPAILWMGSGELAGLPAPVLVALACLLGWTVLFHRTVFGRWVYATGGNRSAAKASLVPVRFVEIAVYALAGGSAGLGALVVMGRLGSAQPLAGMGLEFSAITAAIIGGTKLSGGEGSVLGTAVGAILLGIVGAGLSFLQVPQQAIYLVTGALVILAVMISQPATITAWFRRPASAAASPKRAAAAGSALARPHRLDLKGLGKSFPGVRALDGVGFSIGSGEVVALAGENGAGKSTLVKCLSGVQAPDDGEIVVDGEAVRFRSASDVKGISVIHQHFSLVPDLTVLENLFLGRELRNALGLLDRARMRREALSVLGPFDLAIDLDAELGRLSVGDRQMVEIARAILADAWLFIMDEPTSALSNRERDHLVRIIGSLTERGAAVLYISHKMEEIFELSSRVVVLRDGRLVGERQTAGLDERQLIAMMVGRDVVDVFPHVETEVGDVLLRVRGLGDGGILKAADFDVRAGEIVAIAGLMGAGRSEILRAVAGQSRQRSGTVEVAGRALAPGDPAGANRAGIVLVPEDRHREGFVGTLSIRDNLGLVWMRGRSRFGLVSPSGLAGLGAGLVRSLGVRPAQLGKRARELSGGNQQKVVIGKWLATEPTVILLDEPTRGVDVGAKSDLHALIAGFKARGAAILMVSSELPEVLGVADRILVVHEGRIAGELPRGASEHEITELAFGRKAVHRGGSAASPGANGS